MKLLLATSLVVVSIASATAFAADTGKYKSPKDACLRGVEDAKEAYAAKDVGEKAAVEAEKLIEISAHLCEQGNFAYADDLLELVRSMLATE